MNDRTKLFLAAGLCLFGLGLGWAATPGSQGYLTPGTISPGSCIATSDGYLDCTPGTYTAGYYVAGTPDGAARGFEADARVILVSAVVLLLWAARRRTASSRRTVQLVTVGLIFFSVSAGTEGQIAGASVGVTAALLLVSALRGSAHDRGSTGVPVEPEPVRSPRPPAVGTAF